MKLIPSYTRNFKTIIKTKFLANFTNKINADLKLL